MVLGGGGVGRKIAAGFLQIFSSYAPAIAYPSTERNKPIDSFFFKQKTFRTKTKLQLYIGKCTRSKLYSWRVSIKYLHSQPIVREFLLYGLYARIYHKCQRPFRLCPPIGQCLNQELTAFSFEKVSFIFRGNFMNKVKINFLLSFSIFLNSN